ncbi:LacI family DNA-binding transcriptional regulator [Actinospica durhamensis]|uniref:LacI family DNA-binding transcriptional regulator n=1 Tax=Actinospica durhamensis TaxID=1508375 RepID=A0A941EVP7_9ACTN|nr:LacI family DNA-binding transcriptional regulator [Actinospica durhamensis]MBR7839027.1 LacI family DNA-binding transcriptional regulator [Actinospica durhamensis]
MRRAPSRITSSDVAREAGVSQTTVSFVLNGTRGQTIPEETRRRVLEAAKRLDYRPRASARSLAAGRSDVVLLALPGVPISANLSRFIEQFAAALAEYGLSLVTHLAEGRPLPDLCAAVDASAVVSLIPFDDETAQALRRAGAEVVLGAGEQGSAGLQEIGRLQARHIISLGRDRLGYALPGGHASQWRVQERLRGVAAECADSGLAEPVAREVEMDAEAAALAVDDWVAESVTGVCAYNDETAIAVLAGLHLRGLRAPQDIAVIGVGDVATARVSIPALSTIGFDYAEQGRELAQAVAARLDLVSEPVPAVEGIARPRLILRASA